MKKLALLLVMGMALAGCSGKEETPPVSFERLGGATYGGEHLAVQGNYVYVAGTKFYILDVSSTTSPSWEGEIEYANVTFWGLDLKSDMAFAVANATGVGVLLAIDVSDPANPSTVDFKLTTELWDIDVDGNYAYIAAGSLGLVVYDIGTVPGMTQVGGLNLGGDAREIRKSGNYLYITGPYGSEVWVVDVSTPTSPTLAGSVTMSGSAKGQDVEVSSGTALVSCPEGLVILDVSDPSSPAELSRTDPTDDPYAACFDGNYAYVATKVSGENNAYILALDISNTSSPSQVATSIDCGGSAKDIAYLNGFCYLLTSDNMFIYRVTKE